MSATGTHAPAPTGAQPDGGVGGPGAAIWASRALVTTAALGLGFLTYWATIHAHDAGAPPSWLGPAATWTAAAFVLLWAGALAGWYLARPGQVRPVAVVVVGSSTILALLMALPPLGRCAGSEDRLLTPVWQALTLFVGTTPGGFGGSGAPCPGGVPLAIQVARFLALIAVFGTATALGVNLASRQIDRIWARYSSFQDVVIGLTADGLTVVQELVRRSDQERPGGGHGSGRPPLLALFTQEQSANEAQARALGVRTAPYDRDRLGDQGRLELRLSNYLTRGWSRRRRRVAVARVWVFDSDPFTAAELARLAHGILDEAAADPDRTDVPQVWAVIDDRQLADSIRVSWLTEDASRGPGEPTSTTVCPAEITAMELIGRVARHFRDTDYDLVICGDSDLAESLLFELAMRQWEESDLTAAWATHCASCACTDPTGGRGAVAHVPDRPVPELPNEPADLLVGGRMPERITLVSANASAMVGQVTRSLPAALAEGLRRVRVQAVDWRRLTPHHAPALPARRHAGPGSRATAVIVADSLGPFDAHLGQRLLGLGSRQTSVWLPTVRPGRIDPQGARAKVLPEGHIQEYERNLFLADTVPEDAWTRIARHAHERYRRVNFTLDPTRADKRRPWWASSDAGRAIPPCRRSNMDSVLQTLAWFCGQGFRWSRLGLVARPAEVLDPNAGPPAGLSDEQYQDLLRREFVRYNQETEPLYEFVEADFTPGQQDFTDTTIRTVLATLAANGNWPVREEPGAAGRSGG